MRILHVANFNTHKYGADLYATDRKISAGLVRNGHFVYDFSYRDICRNESLFHTTKMGGGKMNRRLAEACEKIRPHALLLGHSELITAETLATLRRRMADMRIGLWYVDALFHTEKMRHIEARLPSIDVVFATTGGPLLAAYAQENCIAAFMPNIVDPAVETGRAHARTSFAHDFIFCGRDSGDANRQQFMTRLREETAKHLRTTFHGCLGSPPLTGQAYIDFLARSKMGLNISRRNDVHMYSSDRLAQLLGNGLLTFCPKVPGLSDLFTADEIAYFDDFDDLLDQIRFYHENDTPRRKLAQKGWQKAHDTCNCMRVTRYMLELLFAKNFTADYEWHHEIYRSQSGKKTIVT